MMVQQKELLGFVCAPPNVPKPTERRSALIDHLLCILVLSLVWIDLFVVIEEFPVLVYQFSLHKYAREWLQRNPRFPGAR